MYFHKPLSNPYKDSKTDVRKEISCFKKTLKQKYVYYYALSKNNL